MRLAAFRIYAIRPIDWYSQIPKDNADPIPLYCVKLTNNNILIDARVKGLKARSINYSCDANCMFQKWIVNGEYRLGIFAKQDISKDTELTIDYGWDAIKGY